MKAMLLTDIGTIDDTSEPLTLVDIPQPVAGAGEILLRVHTCGVCHTEPPIYRHRGGSADVCRRCPLQMWQRGTLKSVFV